MGGVAGMVAASDPFIMQYADSCPEDQVGWGRFTLETLSQQNPYTAQDATNLTVSVSGRTLEMNGCGSRVSSGRW